MNKFFILLCLAILTIGFVATAQANVKQLQEQQIGAERPGSKTPAPVPEPASMALLAGGLAGLYGLKKKFGKN